MRWPTNHAVSPAQARRLQEYWSARVRAQLESGPVTSVAGVDVGIRGDHACAAVVVFSFPELVLLDLAWHRRPVEFPYVPGLLGFREVPCILEAFAKLRVLPDVLLVDGHGRAHPRRFGVATHLGVALDRPTLGCAKSLLVGSFREPGARRGCSTRLLAGGEVVGRVVRTRSGVRPVFVSIGHRVDLAGAVRLVLRCARGFRLPEPIRAAHRAAAIHAQRVDRSQARK